MRLIEICDMVTPPPLLSISSKPLVIEESHGSDIAVLSPNVPRAQLMTGPVAIETGIVSRKNQVLSGLQADISAELLLHHRAEILHW